MPERPTASNITDDQLDALWGALDEIEEKHARWRGKCVHCLSAFPCSTVKIIIRQRSIAMKEPECPTEA